LLYAPKRFLSYASSKPKALEQRNRFVENERPYLETKAASRKFGMMAS
jgi:hypothetical protein